MIELADIANGPLSAETTVSGALPSALSSNGASFAVNWQAAITLPAVATVESTNRAAALNPPRVAAPARSAA
jgi:hypothetical protein